MSSALEGGMKTPDRALGLDRIVILGGPHGSSKVSLDELDRAQAIVMHLNGDSESVLQAYRSILPAYGKRVAVAFDIDTSAMERNRIAYDAMRYGSSVHLSLGMAYKRAQALVGVYADDKVIVIGDSAVPRDSIAEATTRGYQVVMNLSPSRGYFNIGGYLPPCCSENAVAVVSRWESASDGLYRMPGRLLSHALGVLDENKIRRFSNLADAYTAAKGRVKIAQSNPPQDL